MKFHNPKLPFKYKMPASLQEQKLCQFYTKPEIVDLCWGYLKSVRHVDNFRFIEPSAGTGEWLRVLPENTIAYDIAPKEPRVKRANFLETLSFDTACLDWIIIVTIPAIYWAIDFIRYHQ